MKREKCTEEVKLHIPQAMKDDLKTLAALNGFTSLSAYIRYVLDGHSHFTTADKAERRLTARTDGQLEHFVARIEG